MVTRVGGLVYPLLEEAEKVWGGEEGPGHGDPIAGAVRQCRFDRAFALEAAVGEEAEFVDRPFAGALGGIDEPEPA